MIYGSRIQQSLQGHVDRTTTYSFLATTDEILLQPVNKVLTIAKLVDST